VRTSDPGAADGNSSDSKVLAIRTDPACRISVSGEIDVANCDQLAAAIPTGGPVWLDFSEVTFIDSSCLRVLVNAHKRTKAGGHGWHLAGLRDGPLRVIEISGLYETLCGETE
jgi:anti-sigma B factor antagonist